MKKLFILFLILIFSFAKLGMGDTYLPAIQESEAYRRYVNRPKVEASKLIYLMDRFKNSAFKVIYDGQEYDSDFALKEAKAYVARHYKNQKAESWIKTNAYRTISKNGIIYLKYPDGKLRPLRDALIEELHALQEFEKAKS